MPSRVIYPINSLIFCVWIYLKHIHDLQEHQYALNVVHIPSALLLVFVQDTTKHFLLQVPSLPIYSSKPNCFHILKCGIVDSRSQALPGSSFWSLAVCKNDQVIKTGAGEGLRMRLCTRSCKSCCFALKLQHKAAQHCSASYATAYTS